MNDVLWIISTSFENTAFMLLYKKISNKSEDIRIMRDFSFILLTVIETSIYNILTSYFNTLLYDFIKTFIFFVFGMMFIMLIYKETIINAFVYYVLSDTMLVFLELPTLIFMNLLKLVIKITNIYVFTLIGALTSLILVYTFYKVFPTKIFDKYRNILSQVKFVFANLIIYIVIIKFLLLYNPKLIARYYLIFILISILYGIISVMSIIYNYKIIDQRSKLEIYHKYMPTTLGLMEEVKRRQHDFKNHINTIYGIVQTSDMENLKQDLEEYIISLNCSFKSMDEVIKIDNGIAAAIIYSKLLTGRQNKISFIYNVECSLKDFPLENYELSEVLNNLIDNSFEAVTDEEEKYRSVELKIGYDEGEYFIETKNTGLKIKTNEINKIFNRGFSTKRDSNHGYGLYNVKKIVEKYNGYFEVSMEDKYLIIKLCIPN